MEGKGVGRPRGFDQEGALRRAVDVFWVRGYAATSLDELLQAMGIARSSFYATFGSKHAVMLAALELYTTELHERMRVAATADGQSPRAALRAVLRIAACSARPSDGCLFINLATEMAPRDAQVREAGRRYLGKVDRLVASLLVRCGFDGPEAEDVGGALLALAAGAVMMRKAGQPQARIEKMLDTAEHLIDQSGRSGRADALDPSDRTNGGRG